MSVVWPRNDGNLPLDVTIDRDPASPTFDQIIMVRVKWQGFTIRQQFPWTRP